MAARKKTRSVWTAGKLRERIDHRGSAVELYLDVAALQTQRLLETTTDHVSRERLSICGSAIGNLKRLVEGIPRSPPISAAVFVDDDVWYVHLSKKETEMLRGLADTTQIPVHLDAWMSDTVPFLFCASRRTKTPPPRDGRDVVQCILH